MHEEVFGRPLTPIEESVLSRAREMAGDVAEFALEGLERGDASLVEELRHHHAGALLTEFEWLIGKLKTTAFHTSKIVDAEEDSGQETADRVNNGLVFQASNIKYRLGLTREKARKFLANAKEVEKMWRV